MVFKATCYRLTFPCIVPTILWMRIVPRFLMLLALASPVIGQETPSAALITIGPGDASYERYGHNMLQLRDPGRKLDVVYNWGIFDFEEKNFIFNFVQGRLWYWMAAGDTQRSVDYYRGQDRTIWVQELNLSPAQVSLLIDFCEWNSQPANRGYRYDYYRDNCSTRVRDAVDSVLGGQIKRQATSRPSEVTDRSETRRLMAEILPLYVGLNYVLGQPTDRKLSVWEEMFIPMRMRERFNKLTIMDESGMRIPLVKSETVVHVSGHIQERTAPPNWLGWFLLVGALIGGAQGWLGYRASRGTSRGATWGFGIVAAGWCLLCGIGGLILSYLWLFTDHAAARPNENILQLGPWSLLLVVLVPLVMRRRSPSPGTPEEGAGEGSGGQQRKPKEPSPSPLPEYRARGPKGRRLGGASVHRAAFILAAAGAGLSIVGLILQVLPIMNQVNGEIIALALPAHAGLAWGMWQIHAARARGPATFQRSTT